MRLHALLLLAQAADAFQRPPTLPSCTSTRGQLCGVVAGTQRKAATQLLHTLRAQMVTRDVIAAGDGVTFPKEGDTLTVHYEGKLARGGTVFDCSYGGDPFTFQIGMGQVIKGWDRGMMEMSLGEKAVLNIAPFMGYGPQGAPPTIPPMSPLVFTIELLAIERKVAS